MMNRSSVPSPPSSVPSPSSSELALDTNASNPYESMYSSFRLYQVGTCTTPISNAFVASYPVLIAPYWQTYYLDPPNTPQSFVSVMILSTGLRLTLTTCQAASVWFVNYVDTQQAQIATYLNGQWWFVVPAPASVNPNNNGQAQAESGSLALTASPPSTTGSFYLDSTMQTSQVPQVVNTTTKRKGGWGVTFEAPASSYPPNTAPLFPS